MTGYSSLLLGSDFEDLRKQRGSSSDDFGTCECPLGRTLNRKLLLMLRRRGDNVCGWVNVTTKSGEPSRLDTWIRLRRHQCSVVCGHHLHKPSPCRRSSGCCPSRATAVTFICSPAGDVGSQGLDILNVEVTALYCVNLGSVYRRIVPLRECVTQPYVHVHVHA